MNFHGVPGARIQALPQNYRFELTMETWWSAVQRARVYSDFTGLDALFSYLLKSSTLIRSAVDKRLRPLKSRTFGVIVDGKEDKRLTKLIKNSPFVRELIYQRGLANFTFARVVGVNKDFSTYVYPLRNLDIVNKAVRRMTYEIQDPIYVKSHVNLFWMQTSYNSEDTLGLLEPVARDYINMCNAQNNWQKIVEAAENDTVIEGKITEVVKGGVVAYALSNRVFIPASQTMVPRNGNLASIVGTVQKFKIIEVNPEKHHAVGSIRKPAVEERKANEENFWANIEEGKHYVGKVKSLTNYGAFVDLGGVDGMVHSSELSWTRISNPKDVVSIGDEIEVFVKAFDREKGRVSLGYKTEETNPWNEFTSKYQVGDVADAKIVSIMPFGAFAQILPGVDGLIHISQIANKKLATPAEVLKKGDEVKVKVIDIDTENKKISLSIRALLDEEATGDAEEADAE